MAAPPAPPVVVAPPAVVDAVDAAVVVAAAVVAAAVVAAAVVAAEPPELSLPQAATTSRKPSPATPTVRGRRIDPMRLPLQDLVARRAAPVRLEYTK
jgi:hypothetical protein